MVINWDYLSGFIDADGCIGSYGVHNSVKIQIAQKDKRTLKIIKKFLKDNKINSNIYKYRNDCFNLVIGDKISSYILLCNLKLVLKEDKRKECMELLYNV